MVLNKHGQTLILFIVFIPLMIGILALVVDVGIVINANVHLRGVSELVIKEGLNKNLEEEKIRNLFLKNKVDSQNLQIKMDEDKINIKNNVDVDSIFGAIIGIKNYKIKIDITGYKSGDKVIFD